MNKKTFENCTRKYKNSDINLDEIKKLVDILSPERADNYHDWINVGLCLSHISNNLLDDWLEFSSKSEKYNEHEARELWRNFKDGDLNIGSLHVWARSDNKFEYDNIMAESLRNIIDKSRSKCSQDIANVIYSMYKYEYKYVPGKKNGVWYEYYDHRWHRSNEAISLKTKMGKNVIDEYIKVSAYYQTNALLVDDDRKLEYLKNSETLTQITYTLRDINNKEKLLKECAILFADNDFESKLDANPDLLCCNNGVYDLSKGHFRIGSPDDNISLCTEIDYIEFPHDHEYLIGINEFMKQLFPETDKRKFIFTLLSTFLEGRNPQELFYLLSGCGGNGKSKLVAFMEACFGSYAAKVPTTLFTKTSSGSSNANPEIARLRGVRLISAQETEENETFNVATVKNMTGNDKMIARFLFGDFFEFTPQFKTLFSCNHRPALPADDGGIWRRMINIIFKSRFVDKIKDERNPYEFVRDNYLVEKLEMWKEAFLFLLIDTYIHIYKKEGLIKPQCVLDETEAYRKHNDAITDFIDQKMVDDKTGSLKLEDTYNVYKLWWKDSINHKPPAKAKFKEDMCRIFGPYTKDGWLGKKLIRDIEENIPKLAIDIDTIEAL